MEAATWIYGIRGIPFRCWGALFTVRRRQRKEMNMSLVLYTQFPFLRLPSGKKRFTGDGREKKLLDNREPVNFNCPSRPRGEKMTADDRD